MEYLALLVTQDLMSDVAHSALPNAPVKDVPERDRRPRGALLRRAAAGRLRTLADRLEPSAC